MLADVCGTGREAAAISGLARNTLRILAREGYGVAEVLERLNELILDEGEQARFVTLVHGEITAGPPVSVSLACAGHPQPLLLRAAGGPPGPAAEVQPSLGVLSGQPFRAQDLRLDAGDLLLLVSDGVTNGGTATGCWTKQAGWPGCFARTAARPPGWWPPASPRPPGSSATPRWPTTWPCWCSPRPDGPRKPCPARVPKLTGGPGLTGGIAARWPGAAPGPRPGPG